MAESKEVKKDEKPDAAAAPKKSKKGIILGGAAAAVMVIGAVAATMAVPKQHVERHLLAGPFVSPLSKNEITVNLAGEGSKRYLVMSLNVEYLVYGEQYVVGRLALPAAAGGGEHGGGAAHAEDPVFSARIKDALLKIAASKTRDEVTNPALADAFMEEIRRAIDPILFPVYVGDSTSLSKPDTQSGIRIGESHFKSTLRGLLHEHVLHVDGKAGTVALDDGKAIAFKNTDRDLQLANQAGETVFVDMSSAKPEFAGDVAVGRPGRTTQVYRESFLVQ